MGLYFVAFDKQPLTTDQIQEIQKELPLEFETANQAPKAVSVPPKNVYDSHLDDQVRIEDPNPVLGTKWDSPLDAIPGRLTLEETEKLRAEAEAKRKKLEEEEEAKSKKLEEEEEAKSKKLEEEEEAEKLKESNLHEEKPKGDELEDNKFQKAKSQAATTDGDVKPNEDKPKYENATSERPNKAPKEKGPDIDTGEESKGGQLEENKSETPTDDKSNHENHKGKQKETKEQVPTKKPDSKKAQAENVTYPQKADEEQNVEADEATALDKPVPPADYVAFCVAVKDQAIDLPEFFIHHYHHIDIQRFYIMDDRSEKPLSTALTDYGIPEQYITFESQSPFDRAVGQSEQFEIYDRCFKNHGSKHTWMAFIDADEFIEMTAGNETLQDLLHEFEKHEDIGALAMNWRMHTSSGLKTRPESSRKAFVNCTWDDVDNDGHDSHNRHVKSIVRMSKAVAPKGQHVWELSDGVNTVGEYMDPVTDLAYRSPITRNRIALHHYAGKSRQEFEEKMLRGNAMDDPKTEAFWYSVEHELPQVPCLEMAKYDP
ncbi:hypothetical protein LHYA1_G001726 [Lachnellula hyalina]|uniref:Glycosyltransferase family 92 protein n=1 Tax=Lachnellula hyalina TaxID=1316788 RepID=A0A8H8R968_9HELO|nr:uncharacterized protein LHYA1_G001726 [Lachnellula hyalina]TVY29887.1 hypothetical protein LHYA1_G001726 [Lachnellula hyalina]